MDNDSKSGGYLNVNIEDSIVLIIANLEQINWQIPWMITGKDQASQGSGFCIEIPDLIESYQHHSKINLIKKPKSNPKSSKSSKSNAKSNDTKPTKTKDTKSNATKPTKPNTSKVEYDSNNSIPLKKYIITNAHVVEGTDKIFIRIRKFAKWIKVKRIATLFECDLAILDISDEDVLKHLIPLKFASTPPKTETVYAAGYPLGGLNISITSGIISRLVLRSYTEVTVGFAIQIDAPLNPGNSGGPVVNNDGKLIGIAQSREMGKNLIVNMSYIIPTVFTIFSQCYCTRNVYI
jgi:hypothetical protein